MPTAESQTHGPLGHFVRPVIGVGNFIQPSLRFMILCE